MDGAIRIDSRDGYKKLRRDREDANERQTANYSNRPVTCSFCNEQFPSSETIGEHLLLCGNKTDYCPKCRQYIRRAIFAYHYENNCANPDASTGSVNHPSDPYNTPSTFHRGNLSHLQADPAVGSITDRNHSSTSIVDGRVHQQKQRIKSPVIIKCSYCGHNCAQADSRIHKENCLQNPKNLANSQQLYIAEDCNQSSVEGTGSDQMSYIPIFLKVKYRNSRQSMKQKNDNKTKDRSRQLDAYDDIVNSIPCEYCNEPIEWLHFEEHAKACRDRDHQRTQELSRSVRSSQTSNNWLLLSSDLTNRKTGGFARRCIFCSMSFVAHSLNAHQIHCKKNPRRSTASRLVTSTVLP